MLWIKVQVYWSCIVKDEVILSIWLSGNVQVDVGSAWGPSTSMRLLDVHDIVNNISLKRLSWVVSSCPVALVMVSGPRVVWLRRRLLIRVGLKTWR